MDTTITLYKLRDNLASDSWGLRKTAAAYEDVSITPIEGIEASLKVRYAKPNSPRWQEDLLAITRGIKPDRLQNAATGALLLIRFQGYRFIVAYGIGRHSIDTSSIDQGFGLRVAASVIAPTQIQAAFTRKFIGNGRTSYTAMPSAGPLFHLGIEPTEDLIRQMEGKPPEVFGKGVSGSDTLRLSVSDFSLTGLSGKLAQVMDAYRSKEYRKNYPFIDYFRRLDRSEVDLRHKLDGALEGRMISSGGGVEYGSPANDPHSAPDYYLLRFRDEVTQRVSLLDGEFVTAALSKWAPRHPLQEVHVLGFRDDVEGVFSDHRLRSYAVAEIDMSGHYYAISEGSWYEVDRDNLASVEKALELIPELDLSEFSMQPWTSKYKDEASYNMALAKWCNGTLMDAKNFMMGGLHQKIEVCDVLSPQRDLICVKKATGAAQLSHLFAQGLTSAQLLVSNFEGYRDRVRGKLRPSQAGAPFDVRDWRLVYGIATPKPGPLRKSLFFFSKVLLDRTAIQLRSMGFEMALVRIPYQPNNEQLALF